MFNHQKEFLELLTQQCFPTATAARKLIFKLRLNPQFNDKTNQEIAVLVKKEINEDVIERIGTEIREIVRGIADKFETEMIADGVDVAYLRSSERGQKGKWPRVDDWLWEKYFPRWLSEQQWEELVKKADKIDKWLEVELLVSNVERNVKIPQSIKPTIPLKTKLFMEVNLDYENRYFLLLNQGTDGTRYCFCPSKGFAPKNELPHLTIPQMGAMADVMEFQAVGKEHFLGIVMDKPLSLDWLPPRGDDPLPELNPQRLNDLWVELEKMGNYQMFYQYFDVV